MPWFRTAEALSGKIYAPIFWLQECDGAGLGWAGDDQNVLGKVGGSEMELGGVDVHALDSGENTVCFLGISHAFLWTFTCDLSSIITGKCTVHRALSLRKIPWFGTAEALSGKIYAPIFWFQECDGAGLGWAGDDQNVLGKVGGSEMEFGGVDVHALDSGENTVYFLGISDAFYELLHVI